MTGASAMSNDVSLYGSTSLPHIRWSRERADRTFIGNPALLSPSEDVS
jgi:hypothetical protein